MCDAGPVSVHLRPVLSNLPAYVPGRTVPGAIKLASNETPHPPLPHVLERIAEAAALANRYPDSNSTVLTSALAERYGVDPGRVAVGCGSVSLCTQLVQAVADADEEVIYAWRSFEAYPIIAAVSGASSVQVPLRDYVHDLDAMAESDHRQDPAGVRLQSEQPDRDGRRPRGPCRVPAPRSRGRRGRPRRGLPRVRDRRVVADGLTLLDEHPNLVVLRTFSKAYGLAGLRVGYAIAAEPAGRLGAAADAGALRGDHRGAGRRAGIARARGRGAAARAGGRGRRRARAGP